jgi:hypothetical protein
MTYVWCVTLHSVVTMKLFQPFDTHCSCHPQDGQPQQMTESETESLAYTDISNIYEGN